mmetsp:Transcript_40996/g.112754  ORF Transcript_40996/g.112754 Transcript_40996/m.112754 type:complete len:315 (+) Transcript_40996:1448-2392(+)
MVANQHPTPVPGSARVIARGKDRHATALVVDLEAAQVPRGLVRADNARYVVRPAKLERILCHKWNTSRSLFSGPFWALARYGVGPQEVEQYLVFGVTPGRQLCAGLAPVELVDQLDRDPADGHAPVNNERGSSLSALFRNGGRNRQMRKDLSRGEVEQPSASDAKLACEFGLETVMVGNVRILMVPAYDLDRIRLVALERKEKEQDVQRVPATIYDVSYKEIAIGLGRHAILEEDPNHILHLAMRVTDDDDPPTARNCQPQDVRPFSPPASCHTQNGVHRLRRAHLRSIHVSLAMELPREPRVAAEVSRRIVLE